jgi:ribosomal protein S18 acetylase RimI-like enzyme
MAEIPIEVRPAVPGDIDVLTMLLELLFSIEADFHFDLARQRKGLELMLNHPAGCILVAENRGEVIGMCSGQITISTAEGGPALLVEDVVVKSDRQGRNVGRQLLCALDSWAMSRGVSRLQLLADRNNEKALGFYQKLGWRITSLITLRKYTEITR